MLASIELTGIGGDVVYLLITVAFFGLALLLLKGCERIVGPELTVVTTTEADGAANAATTALADHVTAGAPAARDHDVPVGTDERVAS